MKKDQLAVRGRVRGRVQGVFYRASFQQEARSRDLVGWVRNLKDGSVAFLIQGHAELLQEQLVWARKGPRGARIIDIETEEVPVVLDLASFEIRYDAPLQ